VYFEKRRASRCMQIYMSIVKFQLIVKKFSKKISKHFLCRQNFSFVLKEIIRNCNYLRFLYNLICNNGGLAEWFWNSNVRLDVMPTSVPFFKLIDEFYICKIKNNIYVNCNSFFLNLKYMLHLFC